MIKKLVLASAISVLALPAVGYAVNPFVDVTPDSWAYQSVKELADQGVINGYPDGTFRGTTNITRYEMAQMTAKALANQDRANAEQQAMINRLADEFGGELQSLGVRVSNLEERVGNVKVTGDMRLRYRGSSRDGIVKTNGKSKFDFRGRVQFNATVNKDTNAVIRLRSSDFEFGDSKTNDVTLDRMFVNHKFSKDLSVSAGRVGLTIGDGFLYNDEPIDGVLATYNKNGFQVQAGYGALTSVYGYGFPTSRNSTRRLSKFTTMDADENPTLSILQVRKKFAKATQVSGYYIFGNKNMETDIYGVSIDSKINKFWLGGEWVKGSELDNSDSWIAGVGYGTYNMTKPNSWAVKLQYHDEAKNAPLFNSRTLPWAQNYKGWMGTVQYAFEKNVGLSAYYAFHNKTQDNVSLGNFYRADLMIRF